VAKSRAFPAVPGWLMRVAVAAALWCHAASAADPLSITDLCDQGLAAFKDKNYARAAELFETMLGTVTSEQKQQFKKTISDIHYHLGLCYFQLKKYDAAITNFAHYAQDSPDGMYAEQAGFGVAASQYELERYKEAAASYEQLLNKYQNSKLKVEYVMSLAVCWFELNDNRARGLFERALKLSKDRERQLLCAQYLMAHVAEKIPETEASEILKGLVGSPPRRDALTYLSPYIVKVADRLYEADKVDDALRWYHMILPRKVVIEMYKARLAKLERDAAQAKKRSPGSAEALGLERNAAKFAATLKAMEEAADYTPQIWERLAKTYFKRGDFHESRLIYEEIVAQFGTSEQAPGALFGSLLCNTALGRTERALAVADQFATNYPDSELRGKASYLAGEMLFKLSKYSNAIERFNAELAGNSNSPFAERIRLLIGNAHFMLEQYAFARTAYKQVLEANPSGDYAEDAAYRGAVTLLYLNDPTNALVELEDFRTKYPSSSFADDATYRIAELQYQSAEYRNAVNTLEGFASKYPETQLGIEACMLVADCSLGLMGEASTASDFGDALSNAVAQFHLLQAQTKGVDAKRWRYAVMQEGICYRYAEDNGRVAEYFEGVLKDYPDDPVAGSALGEIADAYQRLGKTDEANDAYRRAIEHSGEDITNDVADKCLTQYAQVLMRDARSNEFVAYLDGWRDRLDTNSLLRARIDGVLLDLFEQTGEAALATQQVMRINALYAATNMPAPLSIRLADRALKSGDCATAKRLYQGIVDGAAVGQPYSRARLGLAALDLRNKDWQAARKAYAELLRFVGDDTLMPAIIYGNGATALGLGDLGTARKYFEALTANREWRGEYTAGAVYGLGECERAAGKLDDAHAFFQRVYVLYGAYKEWVAHAYVAAGMCLEDLKKPEEARRTFDELIAREDLGVYGAQVAIARAHAAKLPEAKPIEQPPSAFVQ